MKDKKEEITFNESGKEIIDREQIDKEIKKLPKEQSSKSHQEKIEIALKKLDNQGSPNPQNGTKIISNTEKTRKESEDFTEKKTIKSPEKSVKYKEKLFKVLNDLNSNESLKPEVKGNEEKQEKSKDKSVDDILELIDSAMKEKEKKQIMGESSDHSIKKSQSDMSDTTIDTKLKKPYNENLIEKIWIKCKYYDNAINERVDLKKIYLQKLGKEYYVFIYDNNLRTYSFSICQIFCELLKYKIPKIEIIDDQYKDEYGLFFCSRKIKEYNKKCYPNEMICNECMKKIRKYMN